LGQPMVARAAQDRVQVAPRRWRRFRGPRDVGPGAHAAREGAVVGPRELDGDLVAVVDVVLVALAPELLVAVEGLQVLLGELVEHSPPRAAVRELNAGDPALPVVGVEREGEAIVAERAESDD